MPLLSVVVPRLTAWPLMSLPLSVTGTLAMPVSPLSRRPLLVLAAAVAE